MADNIFRQDSGTFAVVRAASRTFGGGATVIPPANSASSVAVEDGQSPLVRQQSSRSHVHENHQEMSGRLAQELSAALVRRMPLLFAAATVLWFFLIALFFIFVGAFQATVNKFDKPCDQPLRIYMIVGMLWSQICNYIMKYLTPEGPRNPVRYFRNLMLVQLPGYALIAWGVYMINSCETCQKTNPGLFYAIQKYVYAQVIYSVLSLVMIGTLAFGFRRVIELIGKLSKTPGCEAAVRSLPKIPAGSAELISPQDNTVFICSICLEELTGPSSIVKTPCVHYFHEDCLATWCKNRMSCPMCRQDVGQADDNAV